MILARTSVVVNSALTETLALTSRASQHVKDLAEIDFEHFENKAWTDKWRGDFFTYLWELREDLEHMGARMDQNVKVLKRLQSMHNGTSMVSLAHTSGTKVFNRYIIEYNTGTVILGTDAGVHSRQEGKDHDAGVHSRQEGKGHDAAVHGQREGKDDDAIEDVS
jgi:hypothetical protein